MAKKNKEAKISDFKNINFVLKKVKKRSRKMFYIRIRNKANLKMIGIRDASYKCNEHPIGGDLIFFKEVDSFRVCLVC